jgi:hypothetical protein
MILHNFLSDQHVLGDVKSHPTGKSTILIYDYCPVVWFHYRIVIFSAPPRLIAQPGIVEHRPFQRRAGWQALDFLG